MSGSSPPRDPGSEPSMADIVASIRRSLDEDMGRAGNTPGPEAVLQLDPSMMIPEPQEPTHAPSVRAVEAPAKPEGLVAPEAAAAAANAVGSLVRTLAAERSMPVRTGGPTVEDIVREEIRSLLKDWLDTNLPQMVERLVRAEIERVVGRATP
jgi:cell pole-organizing protein PopZ